MGSAVGSGLGLLGLRRESGSGVGVGAMSPEGGDVAKVTLCVGQSGEVKRLGVESWALE